MRNLKQNKTKLIHVSKVEERKRIHCLLLAVKWSEMPNPDPLYKSRLQGTRP